MFGAIEHPHDTGTRDIVVVVRGPDADMTVRKPDRVAGIWINRDAAKLQGMPTYYYLASTRPLGDIAAHGHAQALRHRARQSAARAHFAAITTPNRSARRSSAIRSRTALYGEAPAGVEFLSDTLFRVHVPVPAAVTRGQYNVEVYLFRDGEVISAQSTPLFIDQTGLERRLYNLAHDSPLLYGLSAVLMAVILGWLSSVSSAARTEADRAPRSHRHGDLPSM